MGCDLNGGPCRSSYGERLNVFALVIYIPPPLGVFLDDLRRELVPHYNPHAHVSVLPPRPLRVDWEEASREARARTEGWAPFDVELASIEIFPQTDVIYIEIGAGAAELYSLHSAMNSSALEFQEPYPYHPHITLAQEVPHERVEELTGLARRRWADYRGPRAFRAERAVFVQNTADNCWLDLAEYSLGAVAVP
jgi:2'-5' RNA ligase superfamily protein